MDETAGKTKTVLAPCMGVGKIVANVTRRASYLIKSQCPDEVELLSLPALLAGDAHERELIQKHPVIAIDGCALRCAAHIFRLYGVEPVAKVEVNQVMKERKLGPGKTRKELEATGKKLSDFTAERVLQALHDEGVEASFVPLDELEGPPPDADAGAGCPHRPIGLIAERADTGGDSDPPSPPFSRGGERPIPDLSAKQAYCPSTEVINPTSATNTVTTSSTPTSPPLEKGGQGGSGDAAIAEAAATTGVCQSGPAGEQTTNGLHHVKSVTVIPCQGIKRTGGRITQRAAYQVVEDRFLGRSQVLCISALAAGVQEDVDMLERFPAVAVNGCGLRCATIAAEHHGIPAVASVDLTAVDPAFKGEAQCLDPDLTETEIAESAKLADAVSNAVEGLLDREIAWSPAKINLHGLIHEPGKINALTGFSYPDGKGYLVQLAKQQLEKSPKDLPYPPFSRGGEQPPPTPPPKPAEEPASIGVACITGKNVISNLFKPKPKTPPAGAEGPQ